MTDITTIPASRVPLVDERTNMVSREWYAFFRTLFNRTGAGLGVDGDKGDIVVSGGNATWTIDDGVIGTAKLGADITPAGKALLNDLTAAIQRQTLGIDASTTPYTPGVIAHWDGNVDPGAASDALDQLARRVATISTSVAFPIGSVFTAVVDTDPYDLLGFGTWEMVGVRRMVGSMDGHLTF